MATDNVLPFKRRDRLGDLPPGAMRILSALIDAADQHITRELDMLRQELKRELLAEVERLNKAG